MLYYLSQYLLREAAGTAWADYLSPLRVFRYITFRSAGAAVTALLLSLWLGPKVIVWLTQLRFGQQQGLELRKIDHRARSFWRKSWRNG